MGHAVIIGVMCNGQRGAACGLSYDLNNRTICCLYRYLAVSCIDDIPPNPQDGRTPLMLAAGAGHLPVARLLVETYHCDVNEESGEVSAWEVMGGVSEYSTCVSSLLVLNLCCNVGPLTYNIYGPFHSGLDQAMAFASSACTHKYRLSKQYKQASIYVKVGFCFHKYPSETCI